jgi:hypothetical protein
MTPAPSCVIWAYLRTCHGASTLFFWSKPSCVIGAYLLTCIGGYFVVGFCLWVMRLTLKKENRPEFRDWMARWKAFWMIFLFGATERAVALTLVLMAPAYLPAFIGGWVLLKFAIGWQREKNENEAATQSFFALIGNVITFAIPIAVGLALYPEALNAWATRK